MADGCIKLSDNNVVIMSDKTGDGRHVAPLRCLADAAAAIKEKGYRKVLVILADELSGESFQAGMHFVEILGQLEVAKQRWLTEMAERGYD